MFDLMEQGDFVLGAWDGWWHDTELPFTSIYASDLLFFFVLFHEGICQYTTDFRFIGFYVSTIRTPALSPLLSRTSFAT